MDEKKKERKPVVRRGKDDPSTDTVNPSPMDDNVVAYLREAAKAFTRVESTIEAEVKSKQNLDATTLTRIGDVSDRIHIQVANFTNERQRMFAELTALKAKKRNLQQRIEVDLETHKAVVENLKTTSEAQLVELRKNLKQMKEDSEKADKWQEIKGTVRKDIQDLIKQIDQLHAKHKNSLQTLQAEHEEECVKIRNSFIRKLRRVRDFMSSEADDDKLAESEGSLLPTAKLNEKLSREVTLYERESKGGRSTRSALVDSKKQIDAQLHVEQSQNEKLVWRNASHSKTARMLNDRLHNLEEQYEAALGSMNCTLADRRSVLFHTITTQADIISDLQSELRILSEEHGTLCAQVERLNHSFDSRHLHLSKAQRLVGTIFSLPPEMLQSAGEELSLLGLDSREQMASFAEKILSG